MAIKSSGSLSFTEIATEFNGSSPRRLTNYYRGGALVLNGPAANANIATSGTIKFSQFYGSTAAVPTAVTISTSATTIVEGGTATFTVTTSTPGQTYYWTIQPVSSGLSAADFTVGTLSGSIAMSSSSRTLSFTSVTDGLSEGNEQFYITLRSGSSSGPIVATSSTVAISDTTAQVQYSADYIVLKYEFTNGTDLDTRTTPTSPAGGTTVGWSFATTSNLPNGTPFITWSGDNTGTGVETVLVDVKAYIAYYGANGPAFAITCGCGWYGTTGTNPVRITSTFYRGGTPVKSGYDWTNPTATTSVDVQAGYVLVTARATSGNLGQTVAYFNYAPDSATGTFTTA